MRVDDAFDFRPAEIYRAVDHKAGVVWLVFRRLDLVAIDIDLDQVRRGDLVEHQSHRINQELAGFARHARRIMREDQIVPAKMANEPGGSKSSSQTVA